MQDCPKAPLLLRVLLQCGIQGGAPRLQVLSSAGSHVIFLAVGGWGNALLAQGVFPAGGGQGCLSLVLNSSVRKAPLPSPSPLRAVIKDMITKLGLQDRDSRFFKEMDSWPVGTEDPKEAVRQFCSQWLEETIRIFQVLPFPTLWVGQGCSTPSPGLCHHRSISFQAKSEPAFCTLLLIRIGAFGSLGVHRGVNGPGKTCGHIRAAGKPWVCVLHAP